jgi:hypothetical protein
MAKKVKTMSRSELGRIAYEAAQVEMQAWHPERPVCRWDDARPSIKEAWIAAGQAVYAAVRMELRQESAS